MKEQWLRLKYITEHSLIIYEDKCIVNLKHYKTLNLPGSGLSKIGSWWIEIYKFRQSRKGSPFLTELSLKKFV